MHNNHGGAGQPRWPHGGSSSSIIQGRILPRNRCALMCIDKHDDDDVQASAREDQPGSGADGEYEATDDRYLP